MSARYALIQFPFLQDYPCLDLSIKGRLIRHSIPNPLYHTSSTNISSYYGRHGSIHPIFYTAFFPIRSYQALLLNLYPWWSRNLLSTIGTMSIPKAFSLSCVYVPYSPLQNCETWQMFKVLFSHMYLTSSIESEMFPRLGVAVILGKRFEKHQPPYFLRRKYLRKNSISRENQSCCIM